MKNKLTYALRPDEHLESAWINELGINDAPVRRRGIAVSLSFLAQHMRTLPVTEAIAFLRCMDLSKKVTTQRQRPGDILVAYRCLSQNPVRLFYTLKGYSPQQLGLNLSGKVKRVFRVLSSMPVLVSYTTAAIDVWSRIEPGQDIVINPRAKTIESTFGVVAAGGALQMIVPYANTHLKCLNP